MSTDISNSVEFALYIGNENLLITYNDFLHLALRNIAGGSNADEIGHSLRHGLHLLD